MREVIKIKLGGAEHAMRPTFEAYGDIEAQLGALRPLYTQVITGSASLSALATIVAIGMRQVERSDGRAVEESTVARRIYDQGVWSDEVIIATSEFLAALGWTPEQRKKIEAEAEKQDQTISA